MVSQCEDNVALVVVLGSLPAMVVAPLLIDVPLPHLSPHAPTMGLYVPHVSLHCSGLPCACIEQ